MEDERREKVLSEMGLRIVRFGNDEVMRTRSGPRWWEKSRNLFEYEKSDP